MSFGSVRRFWKNYPPKVFWQPTLVSRTKTARDQGKKLYSASRVLHWLGQWIKVD